MCGKVNILYRDQEVQNLVEFVSVEKNNEIKQICIFFFIFFFLLAKYCYFYTLKKTECCLQPFSESTLSGWGLEGARYPWNLILKWWWNEWFECFTPSCHNPPLKKISPTLKKKLGIGSSVFCTFLFAPQPNNAGHWKVRVRQKRRRWEGYIDS